MDVMESEERGFVFYKEIQLSKKKVILIFLMLLLFMTTSLKCMYNQADEFCFSTLQNFRLALLNRDFNYINRFLGMIQTSGQKDILINLAINEPGRWDHGMTALHLAAYYNNAGIIYFLVTEGASTEIKINNPKYWFHGRTALHLAAYCGYLDCVQALIVDGKANVNETVDSNSYHYHRGMTALHLASWEGCIDVAGFLIQKGAQVDALVEGLGEYYGMTALHVAILNGRENVAALLIQRGAQVDIVIRSYVQYYHLKTALHLAALCGYDAIVKLLVGNIQDNVRKRTFLEWKDTFGQMAGDCYRIYQAGYGSIIKMATLENRIV